MTDDANILDVANALYALRIAIDEIGVVWLEPGDIREVEQSIIRLHNLLRKHRSKHVST